MLSVVVVVRLDDMAPSQVFECEVAAVGPSGHLLARLFPLCFAVLLVALTACCLFSWGGVPTRDFKDSTDRLHVRRPDVSKCTQNDNKTMETTAITMGVDNFLGTKEDFQQLPWAVAINT